MVCVALFTVLLSLGEYLANVCVQVSTFHANCVWVWQSVINQNNYQLSTIYLFCNQFNLVTSVCEYIFFLNNMLDWGFSNWFHSDCNQPSFIWQPIRQYTFLPRSWLSPDGLWLVSRPVWQGTSKLTLANLANCYHCRAKERQWCGVLRKDRKCNILWILLPNFICVLINQSTCWWRETSKYGTLFFC